MFSSRDRLADIREWLKILATEQGISEIHDDIRKKLYQGSPRISRFLIMVEDHIGREFHPLRIEEREITESNSDVVTDSLAVIGYLGAEGIDLLKTAGGYADHELISVDERVKIKDEWVKFEEQKEWLDALNISLAVVITPLAILMIIVRVK